MEASPNSDALNPAERPVANCGEAMRSRSCPRWTARRGQYVVVNESILLFTGHEKVRT